MSSKTRQRAFECVLRAHTASGGDTDTDGGNGQASPGNNVNGGDGGDSPNGGTGGAGTSGDGQSGNFPGGGGAGGHGSAPFAAAGRGGGAGAYVQKTYAHGELTPGSTLSVVVGSGGSKGTDSRSNGGNGADDEATFEWT